MYQHTRAKWCSTTNSLYLFLLFVVAAVAAACFAFGWCPLLFAYVPRSSTKKNTRKELDFQFTIGFILFTICIFFSLWFGFFLACETHTTSKYPFTNFNCECNGRRRCQLVNDQIKYRISTFSSKNCPSDFCLVFMCVCVWTGESKFECFVYAYICLYVCVCECACLFWVGFFIHFFVAAILWVSDESVCFCLFCLSKKSCSREFQANQEFYIYNICSLFSSVTEYASETNTLKRTWTIAESMHVEKKWNRIHCIYVVVAFFL